MSTSGAGQLLRRQHRPRVAPLRLAAAEPQVVLAAQRLPLLIRCRPDAEHLVARRLRRSVVRELAVAIVEPGDQPGLAPRVEPARQLLGGLAVQPLHHVVAREGGHRRRRQVQQRDEQQRPEARPARRLHVLHRVEAHDHVRQAGGADHQRQRGAEHVDAIPLAGERFGVALEAEILVQLVEPGQQRHRRLADVAAHADRRHRLAGQLPADRDDGHQVGEDQHPILRDLRPRDALHAAERRVDEHDQHADHDADVDRDLEEAREHDADTAHLAGDVREADEQRTQQCDQATTLRLEPVADEVGHREVAARAQVRSQQQRQQHEAAGPPHQVEAAGIAEQRDHAGHRQERRRRHPVGRGRHAVGDRRHAAAGDVEALRVAHARAVGEPQVERERHSDDRERPRLHGHRRASARACATSRRWRASSRVIASA